MQNYGAVCKKKSMFYYAHKGNAFWRIIAEICECPVPETNEEKRRLLLNNHIAIWDVCKNCDIKGSSDNSIKNEIPTDIPDLLKRVPIQKIYVNG